jgi:hypothetical protein
MMWTMKVGKCFSRLLIENDRVEPTTLRAIIVDGASLTVVKDTSSLRILKLPVSISFDDEEIVRKAKTSYPYDI